MKLKQALAIGLSSAILTLPVHKKGHKKCLMENNLDAKQAKENAQLDELNAINSSDAAKK